MRTREEIIIAWARGHYALGWRGWIAAKILKPVIRDLLAKGDGEK